MSESVYSLLKHSQYHSPACVVRQPVHWYLWTQLALLLSTMKNPLVTRSAVKPLKCSGGESHPALLGMFMLGLFLLFKSLRPAVLAFILDSIFCMAVGITWTLRFSLSSCDSKYSFCLAFKANSRKRATVVTGNLVHLSYSAR